MNLQQDRVKPFFGKPLLDSDVHLEHHNVTIEYNRTSRCCVALKSTKQCFVQNPCNTLILHTLCCNKF